ncbi:MAG: phosphatase PAP2 family protein [Methanothrix sp.]|nr:phosphatase PAP2 family protein [Methanothrix sp.]
MIALAFSPLISDLIWHAESAASYWLAADLRIFQFINSGLSNATLDRTMPLLTHLGDSWAAWIFILIMAAINHKPVESRLKKGIILTLIYGFVSASQLAIKHLIERPRPFLEHDAIVRAVFPTDFSFPSGHAATAFMMAVVLSIQYPRYRYAFYFLACLVGFSRVYLGVHYPSDVIAGAIIGYAIAKWMISFRNIKESIEPIK